jgi:diguanylate cyclase (GGDEF)-like protein
LIDSFNSMRESIAHSHSALSKMAFTDELTGLPNRKAFNDHIGALSSHKRRVRLFVGVTIIDLDRFKQINDSLGHDAGDHLLSEFSKQLSLCLRPDDHAARLGGDEFAVILDSLV